MKTAQKSAARVLLLAFSFLFLTNCEDKPNPNNNNNAEIKAPAQIVPLQEAKVLYKTYEKRRVPLIQRYEDSINAKKIDKKFDVARYVQYDYAVIKQYMDYIEQEAKAAKVDISTLRIYFSNYPVGDDSVKHPRQNSVMLSPTINQKGNEYLFYINDSIREAPKAVLLNWDFGPLNNTQMGALTPKVNVSQASVLPNLANSKSTTTKAPFNGGKSLTLNRGNSAPPPPYNN